MKGKRIFSVACAVFMSLALLSAPVYGADWDMGYESLAEAYADYFLVGNIMEPGQTSDDTTTEMFLHYYNGVTAENAMKPTNLTREKGVYNFGAADRLVDWANENNVELHGHTLVWHSQSARWLTYGEDGGVLTREEARANMKDYIDNVAGHYKGRVASWDVVNEAMANSVSSVPTKWENALRRDQKGSDGSPWFQAYANGADESKGESGADYLYDAYVFARQADPDAVLYYNDYNETQSGKREAIAMMVEDINARWAEDERNTEPERLLIEGIGMQSHYWTADFNASSVEKSIVRFIETGAVISITELDIPLGRWDTYKNRKERPTVEEDALQADMYGQVFEVYKKYAGNIHRVTFWGKADQQSWRGEGFPALFGTDYLTKTSFHTILAASKTAAATPEPASTPNPAPTESAPTDNTPENSTDAAATNGGEAAATSTPAATGEDGEDSEDGDDNLVTTVVIIVLIVVTAGTVVLLVLRGRKR